MAIKINTQLDNGIQIDNSYCRVDNIELSKEFMSLSLSKYVEGNKIAFDKIVYVTSYNINGENPFKQAYLYLKSLEEYADAEDC